MIKPHQCILGLGKKSCVFPGCGFPAWHGHDHKAMASRLTDDGYSSYYFWVVFQDVVFQPAMAMTTKLWLPDLQMMGIILIIFGLFSRMWFPSLALAMTTNLWHPILDMMDTTLIIFGLIFRMWFPN